LDFGKIQYCNSGNKIQQQEKEPDVVIINRIREELDQKRRVAINKNKFESTITALKNGKIVNKPKGYRFQIDGYRIYNKEKDFYFTLLCTNKKFVLE
jgi:hypothetical protein